MRIENKRMQEYLQGHGIRAKAMFIWTGSMKGTWRLYSKTKDAYERWWENYELMGKLHALGFRDYDGDPFDNFSGNGGVFQVFARVPKTTTLEMTK